MRNSIIVSLLGVQLGALSVAVLAQELESPEYESASTVEAVQWEPHVSLNFGASGQTEADIDSGGAFSLYRMSAGAALPIEIDEVSSLRSSIKYDFASYDFSDIPAPWDDIHTISLVSIYDWEGNGPWTYYAGGLVRVSAESGADTGDAATGGGLAGANYQYSDTLTLGAGLAGVSQIEDDATLVPLITARWKFAEDWRLKLGLSDVATGGYGLSTVWDLNPEWVLAFGANLHKSRFRIEGKDESDNGVGEDSNVLLYADATYHATPELDLNGYLGVAAGGELRLEDDTGHEISKEDYDPALLIGVKATVKL